MMAETIQTIKQKVVVVVGGGGGEVGLDIIYDRLSFRREGNLLYISHMRLS